MGAKTSLRQNSIAQNIALIAPIFNLNVTRVFPFQQLIVLPRTEWGKALQRIGVTYNLEMQNKSTFSDSLLQDFNMSGIRSTFFNGINQGVGIQTTFGVFKNVLKVTPSMTVGSKLNFQQIDKNYSIITNTVVTDTLQKIGFAHELNASINATTVFYSYYKFIGKNKPILRHLLTPSIGFRYVPKLNNLVSKAAGPNQNIIVFSPFERSIYAAGNIQASSFLNFGFNNTLELKVKSDKDTVSGYRKFRIVDQFSINGNYDFLRDSMNLSDLSFNLRISPLSWMNFVANGTFSMYSWDQITGKPYKFYAWQNGQGIGRIMNTGLNTTITLSPKKSRAIIEQKKEELSKVWNADFAYFALHPELAIYFDIPWKINVSHVYSLVTNTNKTQVNSANWSVVQTLAMNGDVSFTKRWNLASNLNLDVKTQRITNINLSLNRNMHCWALSFYWTPIGGNKSFLLSIRNTSSLFKDAKIEVRRPPAFF
jgi:hypothetical protein